ncbi:polysaccharide export protein EpsE [Amantichitinum ursilacus]|uniref:Polysialic acid transport protein KpsD n=1 Tax=Amantichitinum ursilacus TaxID=857265 RepID=A0A0N0GMV1_9NEIS|nr:polysaccharide export protein EpsE [Amantichitinum ursilacus]KPC51817.1 Polysialic acid transport protein KpsD precursor [Amantichitinum ursilacus]
MMKWLLTLCMACAFALPLAARAENAGEYKLGPGDVIKVSVYDHPDLQLELQLTKDGELSFPLIGQVKLNGASFAEAEQAIAQRLSKGGFVKNPQVNVLISQYRSQRVSIIGEIAKPGRYSLDSATNLLDLLAIAGGLTGNGGDVVQLLRDGKRTDINLPRDINNGKSENTTLRMQNDDVIYVPRMQQYYVYGEVNRSGNFRLEQNQTVMQALAVAGGFNQRASHTSITINRTQPDGSVKTIEVQPTDLVQVNDVIYVKESLF